MAPGAETWKGEPVMRPQLISQPITGICSFGRYPICLDLDELHADFGVLGVP